MRVKRFPTNVKMWVWAAVFVLAVSWCVPVVSYDGREYFSILTVFRELIAAAVQHDDSLTLLGAMFLYYAGASLIIASVFGWVLHCFLVVASARKNEKTKQAA
jgi:hypothetical protein